MVYKLPQYALSIEVSIQGHTVQLTCLIVDNFGVVDILLEQITLSEMKAVIDIHKYQVKFSKTKFLVTPIAKIGLQSGE